MPSWHAFQEKLSSGEVVIIDNFAIEKPKTKEMLSILKNLGLNNRSVLIVLPEKEDVVTLSAQKYTSGVALRGRRILIHTISLLINTLLDDKRCNCKIRGNKGIMKNIYSVIKKPLFTEKGGQSERSGEQDTR